MPVHRERVDPVRAAEGMLLVHRRWFLPDALARPVALAQLARLWRGLLDLGVLDSSAEAKLVRNPLPPGERPELIDLPAHASAGALLAGAGTATLVSQLVWTDEEGRRDPYPGGETADEFREYTLYAVDAPGFVLVPMPPVVLRCGTCGEDLPCAPGRFGIAGLLDLAQTCARCGARLDPARARAELRDGSIFLLEEIASRAALAIELPRAPAAEELPDAAVAHLLEEALGPFDELADDFVAAEQEAG